MNIVVPINEAPSRRGRRTARAGLAAACAAAVLAGCAAAAGGSRQPARFHSLLPPPPTLAGTAAAPPAAADGRAVAWSLAPVTVPAGVDRPQWVVRAPDGTLAVLENERWIAPLADDLRAALAERLAQALGPEEAAPAAGRPRWRIAVDVRRFESDPARAVRLDAAWSVAAAGAGRDAPVACRGSFEQPVEAGYPALAAGHRQTLGRLAEAVAGTVAALDRGSAAACPR